MKRIRIIKRTILSGQVWYVIQQKHFLLKWKWVDGESYSIGNSSNFFPSLEEAMKHICYFDGSKPKEEVIYEN